MEGKMVISTHELFPVIEEMLMSVGSVIFTVSGESMRPWIVHNRDQVKLIGAIGITPRKGDIVLFKNNKGEYVLHRICKVIPVGYHTIGDACLIDDGLIFRSQIIGVVEKIYRKGKEITCNLFLWRSIFSIWLILLPIRKYLLKLYTLLSLIKSRLKFITNVFKYYLI